MEEEQYGSEYAKSNRSACKLCKNTIGMGALRLAIFVQVILNNFNSSKYLLI